MIYLDETDQSWKFDKATDAEKRTLTALGEKYFANAVAAGLVNRMMVAKEEEERSAQPSAKILDFPTMGNA